MNFHLLPRLRRFAVALIFLSNVFALRAADKPVAPELQVADQFFLAIPKAGFGKDYLFSASLIPQGQSPTSHGLAGKIVSFELFPDGVDMYESTKGLVVVLVEGAEAAVSEVRVWAAWVAWEWVVAQVAQAVVVL